MNGQLMAEFRKALPTLKDAEIIAVVAAADQLWEQLAYYGVVDDAGGAEWRRVLPDALLFIRVQANLGPGPAIAWDEAGEKHLSQPPTTDDEEKSEQ